MVDPAAALAKFVDHWAEQHNVVIGAMSREDIVAMLGEFMKALQPPWVELIDTAPAKILQLIDAIQIRKSVHMREEEEHREARKPTPWIIGLEGGFAQVVAQSVSEVLESRPDIHERMKEQLADYLEGAFPEKP